MTQLTAAGFLRTRLDERLSELQASVQAIFGNDIDVGADSIDGQTLGIFAEALSNLDQLAEDIYHSIDPNSATGVALSRIVKLNGIRRASGSYSSCDVLCVGQQGTIIPAGSLIKSTSSNATFATTVDALIDGTGQVLVSCLATEMGAKTAPANTLTKIDSPIYGWQTANNANPATIGRDEETDEALRTRRAVSTSTPAQGILDSVYGTIANLTGVLQARVYENDLDVNDANGLTPHSMYCVVEGGVIQDIVDAIWKKKSSGVTLKGLVTGTAIDSQGNPHTMKFSRPTYSDIYVTVNTSMRTGWPTDGVQRIKDAIVAWGLANQKIGKEVDQSNLYPPIKAIPGHSITSIYIGIAPAPGSPANIAIPYDGLARFDVSRIVVNAT